MICHTFCTACGVEIEIETKNDLISSEEYDALVKKVGAHCIDAHLDPKDKDKNTRFMCYKCKKVICSDIIDDVDRLIVDHTLEFHSEKIESDDGNRIIITELDGCPVFNTYRQIAFPVYKKYEMYKNKHITQKSWDIRSSDDFSEWIIHIKHHLAEMELAISDIENVQKGEEPMLGVDARMWLIEEAQEMERAARDLMDLDHKSRGKVVECKREWIKRLP